MKSTYTRLKLACYCSSMSMSIVGNLPPLLFLTFRSLYGISYSLLGFLIVINFITQLLIDLIFSFFSHRFNIEKTVKLAPLLGAGGLMLYGLWPFFFPENVYPGLLLGTVIFSAATGFNEVLTSPVIAAIPSDDPDREMSKLHSFYAWGTVAVIAIATVFFLFIGAQHWQYLTLLFSLVPVCTFFLFSGSDIPQMQTPEKASGAVAFLKNKTVWLYILSIFLAGAAECTMAQWASGYLEQALGIPKMWGDLFGVALFAVMLGLGRTLFTKFGKDAGGVLLLGFAGAVICYLLCAVTDLPLLGLAACGLTGFCTSMLWPGNLIVAAEKFSASGVILYAVLAAGGDLGAAFGPQLVGIITDATIASPALQSFAVSLGMLPAQFGMKLGIFVGMIFPLLGIPVMVIIRRQRKQ